MNFHGPFEYEKEIDQICNLRWDELTEEDLIEVAWAYYYFSVQFRENLEIACVLYPKDQKLQQLQEEECDTDNLSPWPGVADMAERMNHDEFMRRTLELHDINSERRRGLQEIGEAYLCGVRAINPATRALSIASYEDGGLERVFKSFLRARHWDNPLLQAFRHFLTEHIRFDSDVENGHGALSRHLALSDQILPLWIGFRRLLVDSVPRLGLPSQNGFYMSWSS